MTRSKKGSYTHRGTEIRRCSDPSHGCWYAVQYHTPSGMQYDEQCSAYYNSLEQARDDIDWRCSL